MIAFSPTELGLAVIIIAITGISVVATASFLAQIASATLEVMTNTTAGEGGGEQQTVITPPTTTNISNNNNFSTPLLGRLFSYGEGEGMMTNVNPINESYIEVSYSGNRIILPPNSTDAINATETGNLTISVQPNGLSFNQGQAIIMTGDDGATAKEQQENATITFVLLTRTNPDGSGSGTSVTYFSTNSTGQLAFLDNMIAIGQVEYSPAEGINRFAEWEWKGGTFPFDTGVNSMATTTNNNNVSNALLGPPFMTVEFETASVNAINETFIEIATVNDVTIIPPNATTAKTTINGIETTNTTIDILPNGLDIDKGHSIIVTEGEDGAEEQENATTTFMDISSTNPDDTGTGTGIVFFSTNSTGQLAFLDNMVGINDSEFSERSGAIRIWEWKGGTHPFESMLSRLYLKTLTM
jgi:hypothetical protein